MEIEDKVRSILMDHLCVDSADDDDSLMEDLNADSLDVVELALAFEDEFRVEFHDDEISLNCTVAQIIELVKTKVAA